ncbi:stalk domain-containing protein [Paenibacillus agilis]|uniref:Copper amine oxidase-like N-terminal domain-containing protein n=1 Tax=Paenibacillus agilis TaxID=3020863 RepID=A0A559IEJ5_9BACL|nr:stalk domain-containing protein [Paenibacillus agilis]TVX86084.1 hypothetical protein FPZ44_24420 [Paenibacillus agilis]
MKKLSAIMLTLVMSLTMFAGFASASDSPIVFISGGKSDLHKRIDIFIENGRSYAPFKEVFEALYMDVKYDANTKKVKATREGITKEGLTIEFKLGDSKIYINGVETLADPTLVKNGVTYMPVNYVSKKGTGLTVKPKYPNSTSKDIVVEGETIGKHYKDGSSYYFGEGYIKGEDFIPHGVGKEYDGKGRIFKESTNPPSGIQGKSGYYKDGSIYGWSKYSYPNGDYIIGEYVNGYMIGMAKMYDKEGNYIEDKDFTDNENLQTVRPYLNNR